MDPTLAQLVQQLFAASTEIQQLRTALAEREREIAMLRGTQEAAPQEPLSGPEERGL